jgi:hypothetical protein
MEELFPILGGLAVGAILGFIKPSLRWWVGALLAVLIGLAATIVSGEFRVSWGFLLIDIPLVAISSVAGLAIARRLRLGTWTLPAG